MSRSTIILLKTITWIVCLWPLEILVWGEDLGRAPPGHVGPPVALRGIPVDTGDYLVARHHGPDVPRGSLNVLLDIVHVVNRVWQFLPELDQLLKRRSVASLVHQPPMALLREPVPVRY